MLLFTPGMWSGNLFDFYRMVYPKLVRDLKVPFRMEHGHHRVDDTPVHEAIREAIVNTLIHGDYSVSVGILIQKRPEGFLFRNPDNLRVPLDQALAGGYSDCRNRSLQKMFQMIGEGEQAGSGLPKILSAWKGQHWRVPDLETIRKELSTHHVATVVMPTADGRKLAIRRGSIPEQRPREIYRLLGIAGDPMKPIRTWV